MKVECAHGDRCPGCSYLGVEYALQLEDKRKRLCSVLSAYPELRHVDVSGAEPARPIQGYRTRVKWVVGPAGELGLYGSRDHAVVDTPRCRIAGALSLEIGSAVRAMLRNPNGKSGILSAIDIREVDADGTTRALVTLVVDRRTPSAKLDALARELQHRVPAISSVFVNRREDGAPQILGGDTRLLLGPLALTDTIGTVRVVASAGSFVQAHRGQAAYLESRLVGLAEALTQESGHPPRVLELHAGAGAFGLALAKAGADVTSVESFGPAVTAMTDAARAMGVPITAVHADAERFVASAEGNWDLVVVDPPRRGLSSALRAGIARLRPRAIAYVSCDPETFARDTAHLARLGFGAREVTPVDMLPLTSHVEALAFLRPIAVCGPRELARSESVVLVERSPHAPARAGAPAGALPVLDLVEGASGIAAFRLPDAPNQRTTTVARVRCFVSRIARHGGRIRVRGGRARYDRVRVVSGHSEILLTVEATEPTALVDTLRRLASFGHPLLGDPATGDYAALRHAFDAYGIDRPLVHVEWLKVVASDGDVEAEAPLAVDFDRVLQRLARS